MNDIKCSEAARNAKRRGRDKQTDVTCLTPLSLEEREAKSCLDAKFFAVLEQNSRGRKNNILHSLKKKKENTYAYKCDVMKSVSPECLSQSGLTPVFRVAVKLTVEWHRQKYYLLNILNIFTLAWQLFPQAASLCD